MQRHVQGGGQFNETPQKREAHTEPGGVLESTEWVSRFFFACQHFIGGWLAAHGIGNGHLGSFVVVVVDFVSGFFGVFIV